MIKGWIVLAACAAVAAGFTLATSTSSEAAMVLSGAKADMSMVEQVARKKKRPKAVCTQKLIFTCCTVPGGQEMCDVK